MALRIITADERLAAGNNKTSIALFGPAGSGKTSQLKTLPPDQTLCLDLEAGLKSVQDWPGVSIPIRSFTDALDIACLIGGIDPSPADWKLIADMISPRGLIPLVDMANQGFGDGLDQDAAGLRHLVSAVPELFVAVSCSKNFALYRERTGAAYIVSNVRDGAAIVHSQMERAARSLWSMPPDHGAEVVRRILSSDANRQEWFAELDQMRERLSSLRNRLAARLESFQLGSFARPLRQGKGMFATLPLQPQMIERLAAGHGVYVVPGGRINIAGLPETAVDRLAGILGTVSA